MQVRCHAPVSAAVGKTKLTKVDSLGLRLHQWRPVHTWFGARPSPKPLPGSVACTRPSSSESYQ